MVGGAGRIYGIGIREGRRTGNAAIACHCLHNSSVSHLPLLSMSRRAEVAHITYTPYT